MPLPRHRPPRPRRRPRRPPRPTGERARARPFTVGDVLALVGDARRIAVLGVGSDLRGDDAAGVEVARRLAAILAGGSPRPGLHVAAFDGGAAPENLTGEVVRFAPELVVLVDAAFLGEAPGVVEVVPEERIDGTGLSTHMLPAPVL